MIPMSGSEPAGEHPAGNWQEINEEYLGATLTWLHLRMLRLGPMPEIPFVEQTPERRGLFDNLLVPRRQADALPPPKSTPHTDEIARAAARMTELEEKQPSPALISIARRFGMTSFEREVLLLCAALDLDTRVAPLCARIQDDPARAYPTFALAMALFDNPNWNALSPERPLRYWRLIEISQPSGIALTSSALRCDERILNYIKGLNYLDDRLAPLVSPLETGGTAGDLPPSQAATVEIILDKLEHTIPPRELPVVQLLGSDPVSKHIIAWYTASALDTLVYRLPAGLLPSSASDLETLARLWQRESSLLPVMLYLDAFEIDPTTQADDVTNRLIRFVNRCPEMFFLDTHESWSGLNRSHVVIDINKPTTAEQQAAWADALGNGVDSSPDLLAGQFNLNLPTIHEIAAQALSSNPDHETPGKELKSLLWQGCLDYTRPSLDALAQRIDTRAAWDDLVLMSQEKSLLEQIAAQVRQRSRVYDEWGFREKMNRGLGISALFAGESGTGKTMAAEVIANDLSLYLFRIDLSAVVSKYIGETEKNLRRLFDAAEDSGAILFFDEADALFGKRSEVKDSHDRYANIEINYLLQRMEAYRGLAILATNMKSALDQAFLRRLRFVVQFPFPGPQERSEIWKKAFPPGVPLAEDAWGRLDYDRLGRYSLTGGSIHNAAINAAFLAARLPEVERAVTMAITLDAIQTEFRKLGRPVNPNEFGMPPRPSGEQPAALQSGEEIAL